MMHRYIEQDILDSLKTKITLLTGPRQSGKTTLAKQLMSDFDYLNFDAVEDRLMLKEKSWDRAKPLLILDELHKMKDWKRWLKGLYDKEGVSPQLLGTGSAKLDTYKKVGDSLTGRYFQFRLYPLDLKEVMQCDSAYTAEHAFETLWHCSGFPEPFLNGSETYYKRWRKSHLDIILRQDLIDIQAIRDIQAIETLVYLLKSRVGSSVSYSNLARDLERDVNTVKRWLQLLENLYVIFKITPYHKNIARALLKEPKYYFFDVAQIEHHAGAKLENIVALSLLKTLHHLEDTKGMYTQLHYLRTKDGKELDFLVWIDGKPIYLIEVKISEDTVAPGFHHFMPLFPGVPAVQLVQHIKREKTFENGLAMRALIPWLSCFQFF